MENGKIEIVTEYIYGKTLNELSKNNFGCFKDSEKINIAKSIANALEVIYNQRIIHRNINPENILINEMDYYK